MSTLMLASAKGPKMAAATPGLSCTRRIEICASSFENAMPVTTCCSTISSSPQISVPSGGACGSMSSGLAKLERAHLHHLRAERRELEHLLVGDTRQPLRPRHHPRVAGIDAVDVGIDVA